MFRARNRGRIRAAARLIPALGLASVLTGCDWIFPPPEVRVTRIDIYTDRIEYRTGRYPSVAALAIGLKAARDEPRIVELHDCGRRGELEAVVDILRERGQASFSIVLPEDC
jgi:hypothetical protein